MFFLRHAVQSVPLFLYVSVSVSVSVSGCVCECVCVCDSVVRCLRVIYVVARLIVVRRWRVVCVGSVERRVTRSSVTTTTTNRFSVRTTRVPVRVTLWLSVDMLNYRPSTATNHSHRPVLTDH